MIIAGFFGLATAGYNGIQSVTASAWWQMYGWYIVAGSCLFIGGTLVALYYKGKLAVWRYGASKASEMVAQRQPAPAPSPTPIATSTAPAGTIPPPAAVVVEEKKEAAA